MKKLSICFTIRFHYPEHDPRFAWRYKHFIENVLPRIKAQTYKDFDICIWCNPWHRYHFESIDGVKTFTVKNDPTRYKQHRHNPNKKFFHDFVKYEETIGLEKYDLQLGLDSDDYIEPNYLYEVLKVLDMYAGENKSIHICFQPEMIRLDTGKIEQFKPYTLNRGSAFMALYQPNKEDYRFIYEESHISIIRKADIKVVLPKGYCMATATKGYNESTGV